MEDASIYIRNKKYDAAINRTTWAGSPRMDSTTILMTVAYANTRQYALSCDAYEKTGEISLQKLATIGLSKLPKI